MIEIKRGDRRALTSSELLTLDTKIIPKARQWLREYPQLAQHAVKTLLHWGEPLVDDYGKAYEQPGEPDAATGYRPKTFSEAAE